MIKFSLLPLSELSCHNNSVNCIAWITGGVRLVSQHDQLHFFEISQTIMFYLADGVGGRGSLGCRQWYSFRYIQISSSLSEDSGF